MRGAVLPVSLVMLTRSDAYVSTLTAYRYDGPAFGEAAQAGTGAWIRMFLEAVQIAVEQAATFAEELGELRSDRDQRLTRHRQARGTRDRPRADSAAARLLGLLSEAPLVTAASAERLLGISFGAANRALQDLAEASILSRKQVDRKTTGYLAREVFELLTIAERRMASTHWDTRQSVPNRPVPARPA